MTRRNLFAGNSSGVLQSQPLGNVPLIEVTGDKRVLIENHFGVISYCQSEIFIKVSKGVIEILGDKMEILCMSKERIVICGIIRGVNLRRNSL